MIIKEDFSYESLKYKIQIYYICFSHITWYILVTNDKGYNLNKLMFFMQICVDILRRKE